MKPTAKVFYTGKEKTLYTTSESDTLMVHFRDDLSAFHAKKQASFPGIGELNNAINAFLMQKLMQANIKTHFIRVTEPAKTLVQSLEMIPLECIVRNFAAGAITRRLGIQEAVEFDTPIFEYFYKNDALGDPMVNAYHIRVMKWANISEIQTLETLCHRINDLLREIFIEAGILLVDFKLEFGRANGEIMLGDEITPNVCRLWDAKTRKVLDKDRFRNGMGQVLEAYQEIAKRLGV